MVPFGIRQLECFIAVAEEHHMGRAAARLHMTQPPLTRRISQLERDVGTTLFRRTPHGVELTPAGDVLLERAHQIVGLAEQAAERTLSAADGSAGSLIVGYAGPTALDLVPSLLSGFLTEYPELSLTLVDLPRPEHAAALRDGRIHVGIGCYYPGAPGVTAREVQREPLAVAVPSTHRLAGRSAVELGELQDERLALFPAGVRPSLVDDVITMLAGAGVVVQTPRLVGSITDALTYVATTGVCTVVPWWARAMALRGVSYVPLLGAPTLRVDCIYASAETPAVALRFLDHLDRHHPGVAADAAPPFRVAAASPG